MAEYALAVDLGSEVTAAVSDDAGHRIVSIGDAGQLALPVTVDGVGRLLVGDTTAQPAADEPDRPWWTADLPPLEDAAEQVVQEATLRARRQLAGRCVALTVTTPTSFPARAARVLVERLSKAYPGGRIETYPAVCAAAEFAAQTGALTLDGGEVLVVDWRMGRLDLAVVRRDGTRFDVVGQPFVDDSLPAGRRVIIGGAPIDRTRVQASMAAVLSGIDSPVHAVLLVGSTAVHDAVRNAVSSASPLAQMITLPDDAVVLGGASHAAFLAARPWESASETRERTEPIVVDDDVQFTVYRPRSVHPEEWRRLLVFAHKTEPFESHGVRVDPIEQVALEAEALLGQESSSYVRVARDSDADLPRGTTIRFVPDVEGIEFNPPVREFSWQLPVHREEFLFRADRRLQGRVAHGLLSVFVGTVLIADVSLSIRVDSGSSDSDPEPVPAARYRKIFASYSHLDATIVENVGRVVAAIGDEFMRDVDNLRSGQIWSSELMGYIRECDVFQLYWSSNSMTSDLVSDEWHYALALNRPGFIRPVYWETPRPVSPERNLPPPELDRIHFSYLPVRMPAPPPGESSYAAAARDEPISVPAPVEAAPPGGFGGLPPAPPAPAERPPPEPRRRRSSRAILAMGTAAAAVLIGGSALVANLTSGGGAPNAAPATSTPAVGTTFATPASSAPASGAPPSQAESEFVVSRFIENVNAHDIAGATSLVCPALRTSVANGFADPSSALSYQWNDVVFLNATAASSSLSLRYTATLSRGPQRLPSTATFRMIQQGATPVVCGLAMQ